MESTEQHIIQLMQRGDRKFIDLIYKNYADTFYGILLRMLKDDALAKDVLQDSFVKFWQKADYYDPQKAKLFTWLLAICRNTALDKLRSLQSRSAHEVQMPDSGVYKSESYELKPELMDLKKHLAKLEEKYRDVLIAIFFEGMTQQETSDSLQIPLGTVKSRLKIGLRSLREIFGHNALYLLLAANWIA